MRGTDLFAADLPGADIFDVEEEIGHGTFSEVHRGKSRETGEIVALKYMYYNEEGQRPVHVSREIEALRALSGHANIVQLLSLAEARYSISLILEHCITDLFTIIKNSAGTPLPLDITKSLLQQLLTGVAACHNVGYAHRDLSPGNLLFDNAGTLKLSDFGQARRILGLEIDQSSASSAPLQLSPSVGTRWYRAPELLFGARNYTESIDMWSVGCIFAELLLGKPLFPGSSDIDQLCKIRDALGSLSEQVWPGVVELPDWGKLIFPPQNAKSWEEICPGVDASALRLLGSMLRYDPSRRITAAEALNDAFFSEEPQLAEKAQAAEIVEKLRVKRRTSPSSLLERQII